MTGRFTRNLLRYQVITDEVAAEFEDTADGPRILAVRDTLAQTYGPLVTDVLEDGDVAGALGLATTRTVLGRTELVGTLLAGGLVLVERYPDEVDPVALAVAEAEAARDLAVQGEGQAKAEAEAAVLGRTVAEAEAAALALSLAEAAARIVELERLLAETQTTVPADTGTVVADVRRRR